jgi:dihydroorotate dehydrogenase
VYPLIRRVLFSFSPETSHELSLDLLGAAQRLRLSGLLAKSVADAPRTVMGITFPNSVGLAAGLDKNGDYIDALAALGFGSIEIGTITPRPQPGNPKPRLFRIPEAQGIINRMGFNNQGVDHLIESVKRSKYKGVLGINIGKNFDTPVEKATDDYLICLRKVYEYATYIAVNVSSPNTPGLRSLQFGESLNELLDALKKEQKVLADMHGVYKPIAVKIAPDMNEDEIKQVAQALKHYEIDAVIATNTTLSREGVEGLDFANEQGGLSGGPLTDKSTEVIAVLAEALDGALPIIGVGGIVDGTSAADKIRAGASLVQVYSGFIYRGPDLIKEASEAIAGLS